MAMAFMKMTLRGKSRRWIWAILSFVFVLGVGLGPSLVPNLLRPGEAIAAEVSLSNQVLAMERRLETEFEDYFGRDLTEVTQDPAAIAQTLTQVGEQTSTKPAVLWVMPREKELHLVLITPGQAPIVRDLAEAARPQLDTTVHRFYRDVVSPRPIVRLAAAQKLHDWIIKPFEADYLQAQNIDTILVCLGQGLRGIPIAALHDGQQYLIEKYALTRIPAFNLIDTHYTGLPERKILAMGASKFQTQDPLPAVPLELNTIIEELQTTKTSQRPWQGQSFLNETFTLKNLRNALSSQAFDVAHLATHAAFRTGKPAQSYIQLWDQPLALDHMHHLHWRPLELLVLSACSTALGDDQAELGFAGMALQSGVKSAVASLWNVNDAETLALMGEFYSQLGTASTKAEALRQAQLRMLRGEVRFEENSATTSQGIRLQLSRGAVDLPDALEIPTTDDLSNPFYWASFTMVSSPW